MSESFLFLIGLLAGLYMWMRTMSDPRKKYEDILFRLAVFGREEDMMFYQDALGKEKENKHDV